MAPTEGRVAKPERRGTAAAQLQPVIDEGRH